MVTMVLFPEKTNSTHKLVHVDNNQLLLTALEPYTTTALIELATSRTDTTVSLPQQRRRRKVWEGERRRRGRVEAVKPASWNMSGSVCIFGGITTWTLLVCLLVVVCRKGSHYREDEEEVAADASQATGSSRILHQQNAAMLERLELDGNVRFTNMTAATFDFGRIRFSSPAAVVYPESARDVEATVRAVRSRAAQGLTLAAKGRGHSVHGQAQVCLLEYVDYCSITLYVVV